MTNNNNNERENEMTLEFDNEVTNEELEAANEFYNSLNLELDEIEDEINYIENGQVSFDEMLEAENTFDEVRDSDFYGYDE